MNLALWGISFSRTRIIDRSLCGPLRSRYRRIPQNFLDQLKILYNNIPLSIVEPFQPSLSWSETSSGLSLESQQPLEKRTRRPVWNNLQDGRTQSCQPLLSTRLRSEETASTQTQQSQAANHSICNASSECGVRQVRVFHRPRHEIQCQKGNELILKIMA